MIFTIRILSLPVLLLEKETAFPLLMEENLYADTLEFSKPPHKKAL